MKAAVAAAAAPDQHHGNPYTYHVFAVLFSLGTVTGPHSADTIKDVPFITGHLRVVEFQWRMSAVGEVRDESGAELDEGARYTRKT